MEAAQFIRKKGRNASKKLYEELGLPVGKVLACPKCNTINYWFFPEKNAFHCYRCNMYFAREEMIERPVHYKANIPWSKQNALQKEVKIPTPEEIKFMASNIQHIRKRALFIMCYLTAGRISEVTGLCKKDLSLKKVGERDYLIINMANRKHRHKHFKEIPIPFDKEGELIKLMGAHVNTVAYEDKIFNFDKRYCWQIIKQVSGFNPHFLRHIRLTHLITHYDFNEALLSKFAGWASSQSAKNYMELKWQDITQKL